jgi:hypothetical protein
MKLRLSMIFASTRNSQGPMIVDRNQLIKRLAGNTIKGIYSTWYGIFKGLVAQPRMVDHASRPLSEPPCSAAQRIQSRGSSRTASRP